MTDTEIKSYYTDIYKGTQEGDNLDRNIFLALNIILAYTLGNMGDSNEKFMLAVCFQTDYLTEKTDENIKSISLGDYSVEYSQNSLKSMTICPKARLILESINALNSRVL